MKLGRIVGTVVASQKDPKLEGMRLMLVEDISLELQAKPSFVVAVDSVGAGEGEIVLYASGSSARMTEMTQNRPIDATIMAIVDTLALEHKVIYDKHRDESASREPSDATDAA